MNIWLILFIIFFLIIIGLLLLWLVFPKSTPDLSRVSTAQTLAGLNQPCNNLFSCQNPLVCESICKEPLGGPCSSLADCVSAANACQNRICAIVEPNGLNQPPPCQNNLAVNSANVCKGLANYPCAENSDCLSGSCQSENCSILKQPGQECFLNENCDVGSYCSLGICQNIGIVTGGINAVCNIPDIPCDNNLQCVSNICQSIPEGILEKRRESLKNDKKKEDLRIRMKSGKVYIKRR